MNNQEREAKKKELYKESWETKWKFYKKSNFGYKFPCSFCYHYSESENFEECLIDKDLCSCDDDNNLFGLICEEEDPKKKQELIEKMALEIKKRGGIIE